jgi:hypothetical protein
MILTVVKNRQTYSLVSAATGTRQKTFLCRKTTIRLRIKRPALYKYTRHRKIGEVPSCNRLHWQDPPGELLAMKQVIR